MNVAEFIIKWRKTDLKERSAAQEFFIDLCRLIGHPTPAEADPSGADFCFEKGAAKHGGGDGYADVWKRLFFGWENKGKHKDLDAAFDQLLLYKDSLDNPPLLVVCDMDRIVIRTNFTGTAPITYEIAIERLGEPRNLEILRHVFFDPDKLKPGKTSEAIAQDAADRFATIADSMRARGLDSGKVAHFLDRIVFCLFAEDIGLLPDMVFSRIVEKSAGDSGRFGKLVGQLFEAMAHGGDFGTETIRHFNGNLFDDRAVLDLTQEEAARIGEAVRLDWSAVDPTIFGTLFQRGLDPSMRAQLGAHFTGRADIEDVVENVVMSPLRQEWSEARTTIECVLATGKKTRKTGTEGQVPDKALTPAAMKKARGEAASMVHQFLTRLQTVKVLDPACGSGNFLYVTLLKLKDLEKEVILYAMEKDLGGFLPMVGPWQLYGIEINPYAYDLAQMTVWIGWLQWIRFNGFGQPQEPILRPMTGNFRCMDAIIDLTDPANPKEPEWEKVDFIVGNPPFLGTKKLRAELGDQHVEALFALYGSRIPNFSDLCCYWFEKARAHIAAGECKRAGLLATQAIRGGLNREVLKRIKESGDIFWAESDRDWVLDGANVHVSMIGFGGPDAPDRRLDGKAVPTINANLTSVADITTATRLASNATIGFIADVKAGRFDITEAEALGLLSTPNPHGAPNSDVILPWINSLDVLRRNRHVWIIDFGIDMPREQAALYQEPYRIIDERVRPERSMVKRTRYRELWWLHAEPCAEMRKAIAPLSRFLITPTVSKHRVFAWWTGATLPDHQLVAFARSDDYSFGVLHSCLHEVWALRLGTRLETRPRYTPTTCFETFPFPAATSDQKAAIAAAARDLSTLRENWLNPPEWTREEVLEFPGTVGGPWDRYIDPSTTNHHPSGLAVGTVKYPRLVPRDADSAAKLAKRTLTALYNQRPAWLADCHTKLDAAVAAAYGWEAGMNDEQVIEALLALNTERTSHDHDGQLER